MRLPYKNPLYVINRKTSHAACGAFPRSAVNSYHTRKQQIFASVFVRFYTFMTIFFQRQIAPPSLSVSLSAWPMGLFTSRVAIPSAGVGCLLMTTRSSPRKYRISPAAG